jgi:acetylornithine deacetylase/succinyl-diaminopimelate desuccinylase-like protein
MRATQKKIKKILEDYKLVHTTEVDAEPVDNDIKNPLVQTYAQIAGEITGKPVEWIVSMAGNDGRWFVKDGTALAVGYPAGGNHHGHEEWIAKESLANMEKLFKAYLEAVAKKTPAIKK